MAVAKSKNIKDQSQTNHRNIIKKIPKSKPNSKKGQETPPRRLKSKSSPLARKRVASSPTPLRTACEMASVTPPKVARTLPTVALAPEPRAVLGCIQIPTDTVLDTEGPALVERLPGVEIVIQKIEFDSDLIKADTYQRAASKGDIGRAASTFKPQSRFTVMGLSCTSMSFTLGPDVVHKQLSQGNPNVKTTNMALAQLAALKVLGATKVSLMTPYIEEVSVANMRMLEDGGIQVVRRATMGLEKDEFTSRVTPECISDWAEAVVCDEADAVVIGCSAFRACQPGFIDALEARLKKPVVTSTQAFLWMMVRTAGIEDQISGYGSLFKNH